MKVSVLSNINISPVSKALSKRRDVFETVGYGNDMALLLNPVSQLYEYNPDIVVLIEDIWELTGHSEALDDAKQLITEWFGNLESVIKDNIIYYVSDVYVYGPDSALLSAYDRQMLEACWLTSLYELTERKANVRIFEYNNVVRKLGETNSFSNTMWYMGKILYSNNLIKELTDRIDDLCNKESASYKKVILLDLDNTLWGGLAGENDITPIILSEEHTGLSYKNFQRMLKRIKDRGILLGIVSKNNEADALDIIRNHPHMILREDDFAIMKINWNDKAANIREIAEELNLLPDSFVFIDDNPAERELVRTMLPEVMVANFPDKPEKLCDMIEDVYRCYFDKPVITTEDINKTKLYKAKAESEKLKKASASFEDYVRSLSIVLRRVDEDKNAERICQLLNKTNQFNLTTIRHELSEVKSMIASDSYEVFAFNEADRFADNGVIAVIIVDKSGEKPVIAEYVQSCRVMGKMIEDAIINYIEKYVVGLGFDSLIARYVKTSKNNPVSGLYDNLGYEVIKSDDISRTYEIQLANRPGRNICITFEEG